MSIIRDVAIESQRYLDEAEILLFIGARQSGKTTILKQLQEGLEAKNKPCYFLNLEDPEYLDLLNKNPKNLFKILSLDLNDRNFVFIDEVQYLDNPSNFLKYLFDEYKGKIKLIASGASAFYIDKKFKDSLAGRKKIFNVRTLSFREFLRFKNENDLAKKDFGNVGISQKEKISRYYNEYLIYGGYPRIVLAPFQEKSGLLSEIVYSYIKKDVYEAHIRQEGIFYKLLKIFASQSGSLVNASELAVTLGVSKTAIDNYLYVMQKSFHIILLKPFFKNARKELTRMPKVYFYDLGLRNFLVNNFKLFETREDKGALLENAAFRQLVDGYKEGEIKFWRTVSGHEVDFIVGEKSAFEVKVNPKKFKAKNYKAFLESYPRAAMSIISFGADENAIDSYPVTEVWQI